MRCLSRADLEEIAERVIRAYKKLPDVQCEDLLYIDPELLITRILGFNIDYLHLSSDGSILGLTSFSEIGIEISDDSREDIYFLDGKTILIEKSLKNDSMQKGRCNFTLMHEASHIILKMLFPNEYASAINERKVLCYREEDSTSDWEEWQANALASALLMPKELIEKGLRYAGLPSRLDVVNRIWRKSEYEEFSAICEMLGASKKALAIRMKQLGILGEEYLDHPYAMVDVFVGDEELWLM